MAPRSRMPQLAFPFAAVGLCAGWLSAGLLANPLFDATLRHHQPIAAAVAAIVAALVGFYLTRACAPQQDPFRQPPLFSRLVPVAIVGGATVGGVLGSAWVGASLPLRSVLAGVACALAAVPICATVVRAAQRSARARMGSLVAGSDRRAVWSILAVGIGTAASVGLLDWPGAVGGLIPPPLGALAIAVGATLLVALVLRADRAAARAVEAASTEADDMEARSLDDEAAEAADVARLDLGLGDEVLARIERGRSGYRDRDRSTALLIGSPEHARAALRTAQRRNIAGLVALAGVLTLHGLASSRGSGIAYQMFRCDQGLGGSCRQAATLLERDGKLGRATALYWRGCDAGDEESCKVLLSRGPIPAYQNACDIGDNQSCRALASLLLRGTEKPPRKPDPVAAVEALKQACRRGDKASCSSLREVTESALHEGCFGGSVFDCVELARDREQWGDESAWFEYREQACTLGDETSCAKINRSWTASRAQTAGSRW